MMGTGSRQVHPPRGRETAWVSSVGAAKKAEVDISWDDEGDLLI